jgi:hypothetical protein
VDSRKRAMGVLVVATDKNIILAVAELIRTESRKEVIDILTHVFRCNQKLPPIIVYDAGKALLLEITQSKRVSFVKYLGCLLKSYVQNQWKNKTMKQTAATNIVANSRYLIDRFHLVNHKKVIDFNFIKFPTYDLFFPYHPRNIVSIS